MIKNTFCYGEAMIPHSIDYAFEQIPRFIGYDVLDLDTGEFVDYDKMVELYTLLGFSTVPLVRRCKAKELLEEKITDDIIPRSAYYEGYAEGVIFKNYRLQIYAKLVSDKFREENKMTFGMLKKQAKYEEEIIIAKYCTNARIEKFIIQMMNDGYELDLKMMAILPRKIYEDIWEENWRDIIRKRYTLNLLNMNKLVVKRCLYVLRQRIVNNALSLK